jgi:NAD(P)H dehydrogenase (quinone)
MKTLIIYAHPDVNNELSFNSLILKETEDFLKSKNEQCEIIDLYREKFNPILTKEELYDKDQGKMSADIKKYQQKITESQRIIFIYPIWWSTMPAILKGFFDRVFTSGFAFKYESGIPKKLLGGRTAIVFVSTGAPKIASLIFTGGRFANIIQNDILGFCGIKTKVHQFGGARKLTDNMKADIKKVVRKALG